MLEAMQAALADRAKLRVFDANADQAISVEELETGLERLFAELDANRDGSLRTSEIAKASQRLAAEDAGMPPLRDWNQSGAVEFDEFAAWNRGRFRRADSDQDGTVTQAELTAPPKMPRRPSGGPPGGAPPGGMPPGGKPPSGGGMPGGRLSQSVANDQSGGT
jgi:Ca2+-binding EF-hand superfamily protein